MAEPCLNGYGRTGLRAQLLALTRFANKTSAFVRTPLLVLSFASSRSEAWPLRGLEQEATLLRKAWPLAQLLAQRS